MKSLLQFKDAIIPTECVTDQHVTRPCPLLTNSVELHYK